MRVWILSTVFLLTACVGTTPRQTEVAQFDFGPVAVSAVATVFPVVALRVVASPWLEATAMHYRLNYADDLRRRRYVDSRWVVPPAVLLRRSLERLLLGDAGCRLDVSLDEFEQQFDDAKNSRIQLDVSVAVLPRHGETILARRAFRVEATAASPDARGGAQAARVGVQKLGGEIAMWLNGLTGEVSTRCGGSR